VHSRISTLLRGACIGVVQLASGCTESFPVPISLDSPRRSAAN